MKEPKYQRGEAVKFWYDNGKCRSVHSGVICVVDKFGTFGQRNESSYDIVSTKNGGLCLYKHIRESDIIGGHIHSAGEDYV